MPYTLEQLLKMPDRERDAVCAEVVMGWTRDTRPGAYGARDADGKMWVMAPGFERFDNCFYPSTDWRAAGEVVDKLIDFASVVIASGSDCTTATVQHSDQTVPAHEWSAEVWGDPKDAAPTAITIAAILACQEGGDE